MANKNRKDLAFTKPQVKDWEPDLELPQNVDNPFFKLPADDKARWSRLKNLRTLEIEIEKIKK